MTRNAAIPVLSRIVVAPATRTICNITTEIALGPDQGLTIDWVASFDNLQPINRSFLTSRVGALDGGLAHEICRDIASLTNC